MTMGMALFLGVFKVGMIDKIDEKIIEVEHIVSENQITYFTVSHPKPELNCKISEGSLVVFSKKEIVGCFKPAL